MGILIWGGTFVSLLGLAGLIWCILIVHRARKSGVDDAELRAVMQGVIPRNMAALCLSAIGLIMVVVGILLG